MGRGRRLVSLCRRVAVLLPDISATHSGYRQSSPPPSPHMPSRPCATICHPWPRPTAPSVGDWRRARPATAPALEFELPVRLVAICGWREHGKVTLLNVSGRAATLSDVGFRAGLTPRPLGRASRVLSGPEVPPRCCIVFAAPPSLARRPPTRCVRRPLYATSSGCPQPAAKDRPIRHCDDGQLTNRQRAEPIPAHGRGADLRLYQRRVQQPTNARSCPTWWAGSVGLPAVLVYRISRAAPTRKSSNTAAP
jgi:hypothetical protein